MRSYGCLLCTLLLFQILICKNTTPVFAASEYSQSQVKNRQHFVFKIPKANSIKSILLSFFKRWNPKLVKNVDAMARKYQHNKHILLNRVKKIYNVKHFDEKPTKLQFNLIQFYMRNEPGNIKNVPLILKKYKGREKTFKTILEKHYRGSTLVLPSAQSKKNDTNKVSGECTEKRIKKCEAQTKASQFTLRRSGKNITTR